MFKCSLSVEQLIKTAESTLDSRDFDTVLWQIEDLVEKLTDLLVEHYGGTVVDYSSHGATLLTTREIKE